MTILSFQNFTQSLIFSIIEWIHCVSSVFSTVDYRGKRGSNRSMLKNDINKNNSSIAKKLIFLFDIASVSFLWQNVLISLCILSWSVGLLQITAYWLSVRYPSPSPLHGPCDIDYMVLNSYLLGVPKFTANLYCICLSMTQI